MAEQKVKQATDVNQPAPELIPRAQYDALLAQAQNAINEATATIAKLEADKTILQDTLKTLNKLVDKVFSGIK